MGGVAIAAKISSSHPLCARKNLPNAKRPGNIGRKPNASRPRFRYNPALEQDRNMPLPLARIVSLAINHPAEVSVVQVGVRTAE